MSSGLAPGTKVRIVAGPFQGRHGEVVSLEGGLARVQIVFPGDGPQVGRVRREELAPALDPAHTMWAAIDEAVEARHHREARILAWWGQRVSELEDIERLDHDSLRRLATESAAYEEEIDALVAEERASLRARFEERFGGLDDQGKQDRWSAEQARWTDGQPGRGFVHECSLVTSEQRERGEELRARAERVVACDQRPDTTPVARDAALEQAIAADPDARESYLVYADWLQERGDPRGNLIVAQADPDRPDRLRAAARLLSRQAGYFLGDLAGADLQLGWRWGYLESATMTLREAVEGGQLQRLLALPSARFLRGLRLRGISDGPEVLGRVLEVLAAGRPSRLRRLGLQGFSELDSVASIEEVFPALRELELQGARIHFGQGLSLPLLEQLKLEVMTVLELDVLLRRPPPRLRHLTLRSFRDPDELCTLISSRLLEQLEVLDLSEMWLTEHAIETMVKNAARFAHLRLLDLRMSHATEEALSALRAVGPLVRGWTPRSRHRDLSSEEWSGGLSTELPKPRRGGPLSL